MKLGLLTGAPGTAMLAPPLLLSGSSPPPPPSPDAQLHALRRTISTLIERYASLALEAAEAVGNHSAISVAPRLRPQVTRL